MTTSSAAQDPPPATGGTWWDTWSTLAAEPALVEFFLVMALLVVALLVGMRLSRLAREARSRAAVKDYLLGVEQALSGDVTGARHRLERVLAEDPENHHARLLYGEVLAALGETAEAHKQHLFLHKAFGVRSRRNDLDLARNLLRAGRPAEAVEAARRAAANDPDHREVLELQFRAELAAGFPEDAGRTGVRLARHLDDEGERRRVSGRAAAALALAGTVRLRAGDAAGARALCDEARSVDPEGSDPLRLAACLSLAGEGQQGLRRFLRQIEPPGASGPAASTALLPIGTLPDIARRAAPPLAALAPSAPYRCQACGGVLEAGFAVCVHCGAAGTAVAAEAGLFAPVESPTLLMDEVDANKSHVRRQLDAAIRGDDGAALDLVEIGTPAIEPLLAAAARGGDAAEAVVALLRRMGPSSLPELFAAYGRLKARRLRNLTHLLYGGVGAGVIGRVVQGFGHEARGYFEGLLDTTDRDLRKIVLDYYIGLGDQREFRVVLEHFPPVEVIHRLNAADASALMPLLRSAERGTFLTEGLLTEPIFHRERELLAAIPEATESEVLIGVLQQRGYSPQLTEALVDHLADDATAAAAGRVLDSYGSAAIDHLLLAFADLDRPPPVRQELKRRIRAMGPQVVGPVCGLLGPAQSSFDDDVVDLLAGIGAPAVQPLSEAYRKTSLVEKLGGPLVGRYNHRRVSIIRALARVGGFAELRRLRETENDANLKLRLAQALQSRAAEPDAPAPGDPADEDEPHGQAG